MSRRPFPKRVRLEPSHYSDRDCRFHVVIRAFPQTSPFERAYGELVWSNLLRQRERAAVTIAAACLMPDHLHLLVGPNEQRLDKWLASFKGYTSKLLRAEGYARPVWQPGFYDHLVRDEVDFASVLHYLRQNPVEAGLVEAPERWRWLLLPGT